MGLHGLDGTGNCRDAFHLLLQEIGQEESALHRNIAVPCKNRCKSKGRGARTRSLETGTETAGNWIAMI